MITWLAITCILAIAGYVLTKDKKLFYQISAMLISVLLPFLVVFLISAWFIAPYKTDANVVNTIPHNVVAINDKNTEIEIITDAYEVIRVDKDSIIIVTDDKATNTQLIQDKLGVKEGDIKPWFYFPLWNGTFEYTLIIGG